MSTVNDIVRRALRAVGELRKGQVPTGADAQSGLEHLQGVILDLPGLLKNTHWRDVAVNEAYTAQEGDRCTVTGSGAVTLPTLVSRCGSARPPMDLARVQIIGGSNPGLWVYSATLATWSNVLGLTAESALPFGPEDETGLAAMLAVAMAGEYGAENELPQRTVAVATEASRSLRSRFKKSEPADHSRPWDGPSGSYVGPFYDGCATPFEA